jgi:hypothetical protein
MARKFGARPEGEFITISEAWLTKIAVGIKGADTSSMNNRAKCCGVQ